MSWQEMDHLSRSVIELGDPDALYRVQPGRLFAKLGLGVFLVLFGVVGNYLWWVHGPQRFDHLMLYVLIIFPLMGVALLWHMSRNRGLHVLVYRTGLLRLLRDDVNSFPWPDIRTVHLRVQNVPEPRFEFTEDGRILACWLPVDVPLFQIWNAGVTVTRADDTDIYLGPVLSEYDTLAEEVQRRTFATLWPVVWAHFQNGHTLVFDELEVSQAGLTADHKTLPWRQLGEVTVSQGKLSIKQEGKWLPWRLREVSGVPNPHVLLALLQEGKRTHGALPLPVVDDAARDF